MAGKGYTMMKEKDFEQIKKLMNLGLSNKQIHEITDRSSGTTCLIRKVDTWADYQNERTNIKQRYVENRSKTPEKVELPQASPVLEVHLRVAAASERTATALERLADAWEAQPDKKRGLFN